MKVPELEELYTLYHADVYRYLCSLTHDPTAAEDLLSETFLRALKYLGTFRGDSNVKTWLFTIARNTWCDTLRRSRPTVSTDDLLEEYIAADDTLQEHTEQRLKLQRVRALLRERGERPAAVVLLRAQGYPYAEIAAKLQITENSARVLEHRTRAWLKHKLQEEGYSE